jgi:UDP-N-acetylmuramyl pentapeptide phosphotransferase/UDP-N-acetylglucosamine-1-phosphate transferase
MQTYGGLSFFLCVVSMLCLFFDNEQAGRWTFAVSLLCLMGSLAMSVVEIRISLDALELELSDLNAD